MIEIIPAIDLIDGRCVRLTQGDYSRMTSYPASPLEMSRLFAEAGIRRLHIVDLEGAKASEPRNLETLRLIASQGLLSIEWGGGIKSRESLEAVFDAGAQYAIIGSIAVTRPDLMEQWLSEFGGRKIILGADIKDGRVKVNGWLDDSLFTIHDLIDRFIPLGLSEVICTDISRDGMLLSPSTELYLALKERYPRLTFTVSGGISSIDDIRELNRLGISRVIVGKAIYENRISLKEIAGFIAQSH